MYINRFIILSALFLILQDFGQSCELCSFGHWLPWRSCSKTCGGGERKRLRVVCCSNRLSYANCIRTKCRVPDGDIWQTSPCNQICQNGGIFENARCNCSDGWNGPCCNTGNKCILWHYVSSCSCCHFRLCTFRCKNLYPLSKILLRKLPPPNTS